LVSGPDLGQLIARLGGDAAPGERHLDFSYSDVLALVQSLADQHSIFGMNGSTRELAAFMLQQTPTMERTIETAPLLRENGAPSTPPAQAASAFRSLPSDSAYNGAVSADSGQQSVGGFGEAQPRRSAPAASAGSSNPSDNSSMFSPGADVLGLDAAQGSGQH